MARFILRALNGPLEIHLREDLSTTIGRSHKNMVMLTDPTVSGQHCQVEIRSGIVWVEDPGSRNGTHVNGQAIQGSHPMTHGDELRIGRSRFRLDVELEKPLQLSLLELVSHPTGSPEVDAGVPSASSLWGGRVAQAMPFAPEKPPFTPEWFRASQEDRREVGREASPGFRDTLPELVPAAEQTLPGPGTPSDLESDEEVTKVERSLPIRVGTPVSFGMLGSWCMTQSLPVPRFPPELPWHVYEDRYFTTLPEMRYSLHEFLSQDGAAYPLPLFLFGLDAPPGASEQDFFLLIREVGLELYLQMRWTDTAKTWGINTDAWDALEEVGRLREEVARAVLEGRLDSKQKLTVFHSARGNRGWMAPGEIFPRRVDEKAPAWLLKLALRGISGG